MKRFNQAVVGGTFDHLHLGHQTLLLKAREKAKHLTIGLTTDAFVTQKTLASLIEPFFSRKAHLKAFLGAFPHQIIPLNDPLGPAVDNLKYEMILASEETKGNVAKINRLRRKKGLKVLKVVMVKPVYDSEGKLISSSRIRQGLVDREGLAFASLFKKSLKLPQNQRAHFKRPWEKLVSGHPDRLHLAAKKTVKLIDKRKPLLVIAVGDIATISLTDQGFVPHLAIVDLKSNRQPFVSSLKDLGLKPKPDWTITNPAGSLKPKLAATIAKAFKQLLDRPRTRLTLLVKGEEDLAVLPAVLLSPLSSVVVYGQPDQGLVYIPVSEESKAKALRLINKFI